MNYTSLDSTLIFTAYGSFRPLNYCIFTLAFLIYLVSVLLNGLLMLIIYSESSLHKPMYIFVCNLAINGLLGSSTIWPKTMENLLSDTQKISFLACLVQIFGGYFYGATAYSTFSVMAYDRYVSICKPLQYHTIMTPGKVKILLTVANIVPFSGVAIRVYMNSRLPLCSHTLQNLFCDNPTLLDLACVKSALVNLYGLCMYAGLIGLPCIIVLLSYAVILNVSMKASKKAQKKAFSTCSPHLITFINFFLATFFYVAYRRFSSFLPGEVYVLISFDLFVIPPVLNPIIYGIKIQEVRKCIVKTVKKNIFFKSISVFFPHEG